MSTDPRTLAAMHRLRSVLESTAREAGSAQALLQGATGKFNAVSREVIGVVGGSAQQVDRQMVTSLEEATRSTNSAVTTLAAVASAARSVR